MRSITEVVQNLLKPYIDRNIETATGVLGAKNLLPNDATSQVIAGITYTVNADGSVTANGTATATSEFDLFIADSYDDYEPFINKRLILSGCPTGGASDKYGIEAFRVATVDGSAGTVVDYGDGVEFTWLNNGSGAKAKVYIVIKQGVTVSNLIFRPMIRPASITDNTYAPYTKTNRELTLKTAIHHGTISGTTDSYGRLVSTGISIEGFVILEAYIQGQSYIVTPYRFKGGGNASLNFVVTQSDTTNYVRISNTAVTIDYFYIQQ